MKGINVSESLVNSVLDFVKPGHTKRIEEAKADEAKKAETKPKVDEAAETTDTQETEDHICPLCESKLAEPLSEERLHEHVNYFLDIINENFDVDGESLDEVGEEAEEDDAK
jgi:DNA repair exonuclease SbcCD ATPase subunit